MRFQHPEFLYFLFLLAIPIAIHLFSFRQHKTFYFSSILFLKNIEQQSKSVRKIKHLLILISRILFYTAIIVAFAQPYIPLKKEVNQSTSHILAIYIDNSFSMGQLGTEGQLLSEAKEQARKMIHKASQGTKILLVTNEMNVIEQQITSKANILNRLDKINIYPVHQEVNTVLSWVNTLLNSTPEIDDKSIRQYVVFSDFQKTTTSKPISFQPTKNTYVYPFQLIPQSSGNVSIDSVWFDEPNFKIKVNNELNIKLSNYGDEAVSNLELSLDINKTKRTVFTDIDKQASKIVKINYTDYTPGTKTGRLHINDKHLNFDDDYYFTYELTENAKVLIIDGENANSSIAQVYALDTYYHVTTVKIGSFLPEMTKNVNLIVLNGVNQLNEGINEALVNFENKGGSTILFPGTTIDNRSWNPLLNSLRLPNLKTLNKQSIDAEKLAFEAPFFDGIFEKKPKQLNYPKIRKYYNTNSFTGEELLKLQNNDPLLIKSNNNYLYTSCLDSSYSTLTSNSLYPAILLRIAELSQRKLSISHSINAESNIQIYPTESSQKSYHLTSNDIDLIPYYESVNNESYISLRGIISQDNLKQGIYTLKNDVYQTDIALNYQRQESNITSSNKSEIETIFKQIDPSKLFYSSIESGSENIKVDLEKPKEYWRFFLILAVIFLLSEMAIIKFMN